MIKDNYLYSTIYSKIDDFIPEKNSTYIYGFSAEERSKSVNELIAKHKDVKFVRVEEKSKDVILDISSAKEYSLRSAQSIFEFLTLYNSPTLYIDSTGLNNRICASLLNNAFKYINELSISNIKVIYVEPETYDIKRFRTEGVYHDLSERIEGIEPLPGFATIIPPEDEETEFVALLGFEGGRFTYVLENIQPSRDNVFPVIGVPGFRVEYPFIAYWGNRIPLEAMNTWRNIKYAAANSMVEVYDILDKILQESANKKLKVAPIGTKPHAIGAILFAIKNPSQVELIYDNPIRKKQRTDGVGKVIECSVSQLLASR